MSLIQWNENLSVGVKQIDTQHKVLITLINELNEGMKLGKGKDILAEIIVELVNYTVFHFSLEEEYFQKCQYVETIRHTVEHKTFIKEVSKFQSDFNDGRLGLSIDVMTFLSNWLKNHIMKSDQKYAECLAENGIV